MQLEIVFPDTSTCGNAQSKAWLGIHVRMACTQVALTAAATTNICAALYITVYVVNDRLPFESMLLLAAKISIQLS